MSKGRNDPAGAPGAAFCERVIASPYQCTLARDPFSRSCGSVREIDSPAGVREKSSKDRETGPVCNLWRLQAPAASCALTKLALSRDMPLPGNYIQCYIPQNVWRKI